MRRRRAITGYAPLDTVAELRALLLTDVVDSTMLSERLGDQAMAGVWTAHDRVARDLLPLWRGREIDKTDGMLLLFDSAADAVNYALAYHQALASLPVPLKARAGLHVGPVILRENDVDDVALGAKPLEVEGLAKPTTARVMALAQGGQTLISDERTRWRWRWPALADAVARPLDAQGPRRTDRTVRGGSAGRSLRCTARWRQGATVSCASASAGCRCARSRTTCHSRPLPSSAAIVSSARSRRFWPTCAC